MLAFVIFPPWAICPTAFGTTCSSNLSTGKANGFWKYQQCRSLYQYACMQIAYAHYMCITITKFMSSVFSALTLSSAALSLSR